MKKIFVILVLVSNILLAYISEVNAGSKNAGEATIDNILSAISPQTLTIAPLPFKPDPLVAKSSISGIDTNKNSVRDDIEIVLAESLFQDNGKASSSDFNELLDVVKLIQPYETPKTIDMKQFYCRYQSLPIGIKSRISSGTLINLVTDTPARKKAFYQQSINTSGNLGAEICE